MMKLHPHIRRLLSVVIVASVGGLSSIRFANGAEAPPKVGEIAKDFELKTVTGGSLKLSDAAKNGPVVVVVLRGFPGYQCPVCNSQVKQYLAEADKFKSAGTQVLFVYPASSQDAAKRAEEFVKDKKLPDHFHLLIDPEYDFTNKYHLRWSGTDETAYPSTFVIQKNLKITYAKISTSHGDRSKPNDVLKALR